MNTALNIQPSSAIPPHEGEIESETPGFNYAEALLTVKELAGILGIRNRSLRDWILRNGIQIRVEKMVGGMGMIIPLLSLPSDMQAKVLKAKPEMKLQCVKSLEKPAAPLLVALPEWQRQEIAAWMGIFMDCRGKKGFDLFRSLALLEPRYPNTQISPPTYYRKLKIFKEKGPLGLAPAWGKTRGRTKISPEWFLKFSQYYLIEGGPSLLDAHRKAFGAAIRIQPDLTPEQFGSHIAYKRILDKRFDKSKQCLYRQGQLVYNSTWVTHIQRDYSKVMPGEMWVSDHHQLDVGCMWEFADDAIPLDSDLKVVLRTFKTKKPKPCFPWITVWRDFRSGKILSCLIHADAPNSDHVIHSFAMACAKYGVPHAILIDNGKDYRCKAFAGGRDANVRLDMDERSRSICTLLNVIVHYATPYNAKAKPIERDFRKFKEWFCRYLPGYRGGNHVERPEKLGAEIKNGMLLGHEELCAYLDSFINQVLNRFPSEGRHLQGQSPDEFWDTHEKKTRLVPEDELALCCMRATKPREIRSQGVRDASLNLDYYADWMSSKKGHKVYLRRGLVSFMTAFVFDAETNLFLGRAEANFWQADALVKDEEGINRLKSLIKMQRGQLKEMRQLHAGLGLGTEHLDPVGDSIAAMEAKSKARGYIPSSTVTTGTPLETPMAKVLRADKRNRLPAPDPTTLRPMRPEPKKSYNLFDYEKKRAAG